MPSSATAVAVAATTSPRIQALPEPVKTWVLTAFTRSMDDVFLVGVPFMVVALVIAMTMREKPLIERSQGAAARSASEPADADLVAMGH